MAEVKGPIDISSSSKKSVDGSGEKHLDADEIRLAQMGKSHSPFKLTAPKSDRLVQAILRN